jgi:hypothetical protein
MAKTHNSLLIVTFDENDDKEDPLVSPPTYPPANEYDRHLLDLRNRIITHISQVHTWGVYAEGKGVTHILRTIEAMHG